MSVSVHGTNGVTFNDGSLQKTSALTGFRNRIINGDMRIDQRNAGASHTPIGNTCSIDRWNFQLSQASKLNAQRFSITSGRDQVDNNTHALNATSTSAYSVTSSDYFLLGQFIEGFNSADLGWGTSSAKTITISFWVTSSLTGTFGGSLQNAGINRSYPFSYTISSANTWEKKTITIAGDTSGTWVTDNGLGIRLYFGLGAGSTVSGTAGSWASANYLSATGAVSVVGTNGAVFYITGVQLEAGSTATDFERRPIGVEMMLCQRYCWRMSSASTTKIFFQGYMLNLGQLEGFVPFPVPMRTQPTMTSSPVSQFSLRIVNTVITALNYYATVGESEPYTGVLLYTANPTTGNSVGAGQSLISNSSTATFIQFNAEL